MRCGMPEQGRRHDRRRDGPTREIAALRWACKSAARLAGALTARGFRVSETTVGRLLRGLDYRLHALQKKAREGASHTDRNAQFEHIKVVYRR